MSVGCRVSAKPLAKENPIEHVSKPDVEQGDPCELHDVVGDIRDSGEDVFDGRADRSSHVIDIIAREDIEQIIISPNSFMPEELLKTFNDRQRIELLKYLMSMR